MKTKTGIVILSLSFSGNCPAQLLTPTESVSVVAPSLQLPTGASGHSGVAAFSRDGRYVLFESDAPDLVTNDRNRSVDVFLRDRHTQQTLLVSVNHQGLGSANATSGQPAMSADARRVVFASEATDLVADSTNTAANIYLRDWATNRTLLVSVDTAGKSGASGDCRLPTLTPDGRYVAFLSRATNLVNQALPARYGDQVYLRDLVENTTTLVTVDSTGTQFGNGECPGPFPPAISADGRYVAFAYRPLGSPLNLTSGTAAGVTTNQSGIFLRDLREGSTVWISEGTDIFFRDRNNLPYGALEPTSAPKITPDGDFVVFGLTLAGSSAGVTPNRAYFRFDVQARSLLQLSQSYVAPRVPAQDPGPVSSADGRLVAYSAAESTNAVAQVYLWDAETKTSSLMSVDLTGTGAGDHWSEAPLLSEDGRYVAFMSAARNLVTNALPEGEVFDREVRNPQVYIRDRTEGKTTLVSLTKEGNPIEDDTLDFDLSADGKTAFLESSDWTDQENDPAGRNILLSQWQTSLSELISPRAQFPGALTESGRSYSPTAAFGPYGNLVVFASQARDLAPTATNGNPHLFIRDLNSRTTRLLNPRVDLLAARDAGNPVASYNGRFVVFTSRKTDLLPNGPKLVPNLFVHDLETETTTLVSNGDFPDLPPISTDGRYIVFSSIGLSADHSLHVYLRDLTTQTTVDLSRNETGKYISHWPREYALSPDGTQVLLFYNSTSPGTQTPAAYRYDIANKTFTSIKDWAGEGDILWSWMPRFSRDGRYLAFLGYRGSILLRDFQSNTVRTVLPPNTSLLKRIDDLVISANGRFILYGFKDFGLTGPGPTHFELLDTWANDPQPETIAIDHAAARASAGPSFEPSITDDGRFVVFASVANDLVPGDNNRATDVFVRDRAAQKTYLVSSNKAGTGTANLTSNHPILCQDQRTILFQSMATDLIEGSAIPVRRIYLRRLQPDAEPTLKLAITRAGADFLIRIPFTTNPPQLYRSADLTHWEPVPEQQTAIKNNVLEHVVTVETNQRFYRAQQTIGQ